MNQAAIDRIQASFAQFSRRDDELASRFYGRLFRDHPHLRALFPTDMVQQHRHLFTALGLIVKSVDRLGSLRPALMTSGSRHAGYGVQPEHFPMFRDAMLSAMADMGGPSWSKQLASDWRAVFDGVAAMMVEGFMTARRAA